MDFGVLDNPIFHRLLGLDFVLLVGVLGYRPTMSDDGTTGGHEYDGIQEFDRPLPKWWLAIFGVH